MFHPSPILTQHLETPKDIASKKREDTSRTRLPPCKISCRLVALPLTYLSPDKQETPRTSLLRMVWRIIDMKCKAELTTHRMSNPDYWPTADTCRQ